ncbi:hypothetical protein DXT77_27330 [Pseudomonas sp. 91RF]|jgi:hypothetical protein|nr:hypothetical protein DXT77_27330 [Pseudomonas sp. 91RF]
MFSFQTLLSTALSGSYSQGLIHRNRMNEHAADTGNPLRERESVRHWKGMNAKRRNRQAANGPVCGQQKGYLPMQKLEKMRPSRSSELNAPVISPRDC